jgi:hypothetical protein
MPHVPVVTVLSSSLLHCVPAAASGTAVCSINVQFGHDWSGAQAQVVILCPRYCGMHSRQRSPRFSSTTACNISFASLCDWSGEQPSSAWFVLQRFLHQPTIPSAPYAPATCKGCGLLLLSVLLLLCAECPFAHEGEKATRRCPALYRYSSIVCPDTRQVSNSSSAHEQVVG